MLKLDRPLQLSPVFLEKVWGRRDLAPLYPEYWTTFRGKTVHITRPQRKGKTLIGEVWLTGADAVFTNGPLSGMTLGEACRQHGRELCGDGATGGRFPILSKFLFTSDWLSVQVHPDDDYARKHENGSRGKTEMWYIIQAEKNGEMMLGLNPGLDSVSLGAAMTAGNCAGLVQRFKPGAGEAVFVPAGTVHALGPGLILFEAEQNSDVTYRLDDFGRPGLNGKPRPLHLDQAIAVAKPEMPALHDLPRHEFRESYGERRLVMACPFFAVEELSLQKAGNFTGNPSRVETFVALSGEGRVETPEGWYAYRTGDVWLIPPATPSYRLIPEVKGRILKFYVPKIEEDFVKPLAEAGVSASSIQKIVFP
ncbi:MAG: type I phosphomannose isomerase catalytic subunit [Terriglobia bacterium]